MRELIIRFSKEGEYFREIDEERNYFLSEAEVIVQTIRRRLEKEKRKDVKPKAFECWIDGKRLIVTQVVFEKKESLEKQLANTMLAFEQWEEEIRHKYTNLLAEHAEEERQLFLNKEFEAFVVRFDQVLGNPTVKPFPMVLGIGQLKRLFDEVSVHITSGFYSELEEVVGNVSTAYQMNITILERTLFKKGTLGQPGVFEEAVQQLFSDEEKFGRFVLYVGASYQSVPKKRIHALYSRFVPYQNLQQLLFEKVVKELPFHVVMAFQEDFIQALDQKFDDIMFQGFALTTDEMVESLVISPVVMDCEEEVMRVLKEKEEKEKKAAKEAEVQAESKLDLDDENESFLFPTTSSFDDEVVSGNDGSDG